jgi:hypothetical protein
VYGLGSEILEINIVTEQLSFKEAT